MMKILNSKIFIFILGGIIFSGITYVVADNILASEVTYKSTTLDVALNNLYNRAKPNGTIGEPFYTITESGVTYTATKDCILYIYAHYNSSNYAAYIWVNGEYVKYDSEHYVGDLYGKKSHIMYINEGDVIETRSGVGGLTYLLEFYDYE